MAISFTFVPLFALFCYVLLFITFAAAKKSQEIYAFMGMLLTLIGWTGGSLFMRLQLYPGVIFWFDVSLGSLFIMPVFLYLFVHHFVGARGYALKIIWSVGSVIILILNYCHVFLQHPTVMDIGDGQASFIYTMHPAVIIPVLFYGAMVACMVRLLVKEIRKSPIFAPSIRPIIIGMFILFLGNIGDIIPAIGRFPTDTLSGIINALLLFYALYKKRLFKMTLLVSRGTVFVLTAVLTSALFASTLPSIEAFILQAFPQFSGQVTMIIAVTYALFTIFIYLLIQQMLNSLFVHEEMEQARLTREFTHQASKSLKLDEVLQRLITTVRTGIDADKVFICLKDKSGAAFSIVGTASPLDSKNFTFSVDNPMCAWFLSSDQALLTRDFQKTPLYRSMWDAEKAQLSERRIDCIVPLKTEKDLIGLLLLAKNDPHPFSHSDLAFLESVASVASIAIDNASLYERAYYESRVDNLTGLLNRKCFHEKLDEEFGVSSITSLSLIIFNVDDFKLYNQLYGNREGDQALQNIARILAYAAEGKGIAARYGGKEFALILPGYDTAKAYTLAETVARQIGEINRVGGSKTLKKLTVSVGVCSYPHSAANASQLINNADMAVYSAKRSGKNKIVVYSVNAAESHSSSLETPPMDAGVYKEYASTIYALTAAIDAKDHYTFRHSQKVAEYASVLARTIGLNQDHVQIIYEAGLLHDIGKISIPDHILAKPGRLDQDEYAIMKTHVENSIDMIRHLPSLDYVIPAVIGHHERWDGTGYPRGISGEDIPLGARCLAVADAFDAMTSVRSYKPAQPVEYAAGEIIRQAGLQFDPHLAEVFVDLIHAGKIHVDSLSLSS